MSRPVAAAAICAVFALAAAGCGGGSEGPTQALTADTLPATVAQDLETNGFDVKVDTCRLDESRVTETSVPYRCVVTNTKTGERSQVYVPPTMSGEPIKVETDIIGSWLGA